MKQPVFDREIVSTELFAELVPLMAAHWKEIAHFQDIPLDPDFEFYQKVEQTGMLRVFTLRIEGILCGYAVFFVRANPHYKTSIQANQDILYLDPGIRGAVSIRFLRYCSEMLANEGVQAVYHHVKEAHNFGPVLERLGFSHVEHIYVKRLD